MPVTPKQVERFAALFDGNDHSYGVWLPKTGRMHTEIKAVTEEQYAQHLAGKKGLGVVPIMSDGYCMFGAVDIDNHGSSVDLPIDDVRSAFLSHRHKGAICRSKSGGIHIYAFFRDPTPAVQVRKILTRWARDVGYPKAEIFPKQDKLNQDKEGSQQLGNWINLPYFDHQNTNRYAWGGEKLTLDEFLDLAESSLQRPDDRSGADPEHADAPPCIQRLLTEGAPPGLRNEALYNITVYEKRAYPDDYRDKCFDISRTVFDPPLPMIEARRTIASASRRVYKYKCDEEPIKSLCNRPVCLQRKYGVGQDDGVDPNGTNHSALPSFTDLIKYNSEPIKWSVKMDGLLVENLETEDLLRYSKMEKIIVERLGRGAPMVKEKDWRAILNALLETHTVEDVPDDASSSGLIRAKLVEFMKKASLSLGDDFKEDRAILLRGLPVVHKQDGEEYIAFRGQDFQEFLKRTRSEELRGVNIYFAIKRMGLVQSKVRVGDQVVRVWCIPINDEWRSYIKPVTFHTEF